MQSKWGRIRDCQESERGEKGHGPELLRGFSWEGMSEAGKVHCVSLGLDSLNNFSRLWTIDVVYSCLPRLYLALG